MKNIIAFDMYKPGSILNVLNKNTEVKIEDSGISNLFKKESDLSQSNEIKSFEHENKVKQLNKGLVSNPLIAEEDKDGKSKKVVKLSNAGRRIEGRKNKEMVKMRKDQDERTVFVGNVPLKTTKKDLLEIFKKCGKVESIRYRSVPIGDAKMPKKAVAIKKAYHPKGKVMNAYVVFEKEEMVSEAVALNNSILHGVHLRVDSASQKNKVNHEKSVFIGNLPYNCDDEELRRLFEGCGAVESVRVVRDKGTLTGKGFAYIAFKEESSVGLAVRMSGCEFKKRKLRVERSSEKKPLKKNPASVGKVLSKPGVRGSARGEAKGESNQFKVRKGDKKQFEEVKRDKSRYRDRKVLPSKYVKRHGEIKKNAGAVGNKDTVAKSKVEITNVSEDVKMTKKRKTFSNGNKESMNEKVKSKSLKKKERKETTPVIKNKKEIMQKKQSFIKKKTETIEKKKKIKKVIKQKLLKSKKEKLGEILSKK